MSDEVSGPQCNTGAIRFPSDTITLGRLRHSEPHYFSMHALEDGAVVDCDGFSIVRREIRLAEKAFAEVLGLPDPYPNEAQDRSALIDELDAAYREYGLSAGRRSSLELIHGIEAAAVAQARQFGGPGR